MHVCVCVCVCVCSCASFSASVAPLSRFNRNAENVWLQKDIWWESVKPKTTEKTEEKQKVLR